MRAKFRQLRVEQLERALAMLPPAQNIPRPTKGWLRAIREATGITVSETARRMGRAPSLVIQQERAEADYRITLRSLGKAAEALGCQLVYVLVPKNGSIYELAEERARNKATENVRAVEHSMALEDQAVGGVPEKITAETQRILKRGRKK
jgi:predicted DNA-binding mobile mystery protein A